MFCKRSASGIWQRVPSRSEEKLTTLALSALEEVTARAHREAVERTWGIRLALAYLAYNASQQPNFVRWPFDRFWSAMASPDIIGRWQNMNASLNGIYIAVGLQRDHRRVTEFEDRACKKVETRRD